MTNHLIERDRLWCLALLAEDPAIIQRVTGRFIGLRDNPTVEPHPFVVPSRCCVRCGRNAGDPIHTVPSKT